ncbi:protein SUPPRESSOR OF MAX2 1-like [Curcuma longa]|uniref:protein SUPPRESSOR OF MAX2 1-like n=1 Tax=Curcuma longa TaxID=136217 RepID=UPI003D9EE78D
MRAGLSTIQQTLTQEASRVLTESIAEAARRCHGQTTPLHVAATLLAAPAGLLRQACIRSHPQSSHPLQCRALELCFSVALDRLPAANPGHAAEPPISNALMAALKRAQANQRRGCPEQQQQPLLAVKVELEQLLMSMLDDPSVSRVMREASFSSIAVKAAVEQSLSSSSSSAAAAAGPEPSVISLAAASPAPSTSLLPILNNRAAASRNLYLNPRLHQHQSSNGDAAPIAAGGAADHLRAEEVKRVLDILSRSRKRNPILVGDCNLDSVMRDVLQRIQSTDASSPLRNAQVVPFAKNLAAAVPAPDHSQITTKIRELGRSIESTISSGDRGVIVDLGDLKWLVETPGAGSIQPQKPTISEAGRVAVEEMGKLRKQFEDGGSLWFIGAATSATFIRCQVYHPTMENDWDLQAVPIASRPSLPTMFPRFGGSGNSVEGLTASKGIVGIGATVVPLRRAPSSTDPSSGRTALCPLCTEGYERELAKLVAKEFEKYSAKPNEGEGLPQWLQVAKHSSAGNAMASAAPLQCKEEELLWKKSTEELLRRWSETCSRLHQNHRPSPIGSKLFLSSALSKPPFTVLRSHPSSERTLREVSPPGSPVKTDLVLGSSVASNCSPEKTHRERLKDFNGCAPDAFPGQQRAKVAAISDTDMFKRLLKGLTERVSWQPEAASAVADAVMRCKCGNGKKRGGATKGDAWLLLLGPDKVGKKKIASTLSEVVFGAGPAVINFGRAPSAVDNGEESNLSHRGKTLMDRTVEAVRRNPFAMVVLENVDQADMLTQSKIKQAIERGRLLDSNGREVSLGSIIFVLTADWLPEELKHAYHSFVQYEQSILDLAYGGTELELTTADRPGKRRPNWVCDSDQPMKLRKESSLSLDLNLSVGVGVGVDAGTAEAGEGSRNSSDITTEHEYDKGRLAVNNPPSSLPPDFLELVDEAVTFKPFDFAQLRGHIRESVSVKFTAIMGQGRAIRIDDDALDRIVGGLWLSGAVLDEWAERVLVPSLRQLRDNLKADGAGLLVIRLSTVKRNLLPRSRINDWLPTTVAVAIAGD